MHIYANACITEHVVRPSDVAGGFRCGSITKSLQVKLPVGDHMKKLLSN